MTRKRRESTDANTKWPQIPKGIENQRRRRNRLPNQLAEDFEPLGAYLFGSTTVFYEFFHANGYRLTRSAVEENSVSRQFRAHQGWIYAFYGHDDVPIYIGETGRTLRDRFKEHAGKKWWPQWLAVNVLRCPDKGLRKYFESMLGIAGGYAENRAQPSDADDLFDQVVRSLLALGNNLENTPQIPIKNIRGQIDMVREMLRTEDQF